MSEYELRPHHGLCIGFFGGKGYSDEFNRNMSYIVAMLKRNDPVVKLVKGTDVICKACPNNEDGACVTQGKVTAYDEKVLELCGLNDGDSLRWSRFSKLVDSRILSENKLEEVCGDCCWNYICSKL